MKLKHKIDYKGLKDYLKSIKYSEIETSWNKPANAKLIEGNSLADIEFFELDTSIMPLNSLIQYGEPFMLDALGNDLSIVILSKRGYKLPNGRIIEAKFVTTVIDDCRALFGNVLSGYYKIPSQFICKIKK